MATKLLVVVSDPHVGSVWGLWPEDAKNRFGNPLPRNPLQEAMGVKWKEGCRYIKHLCGDEPYDLVVNGDIIEGNHHRTDEIMTPSEAEMMEAARSVLRPLTDQAGKVYLVEGTECHTKEIETALGNMLPNAALDPTSGLPAFKHLRLAMHGCIIDAAHHMPTTSRAYLEASGMGIVMGNSRVNMARKGIRPADVFLRAHRHVPGFFCDLHSLIVVTGAWQMLTRHGRKVATDSLPTPTICLLDWRGRPEGSLPGVHHYKAEFPPPPTV